MALTQAIIRDAGDIAASVRRMTQSLLSQWYDWLCRHSSEEDEWRGVEHWQRHVPRRLTSSLQTMDVDGWYESDPTLRYVYETLDSVTQYSVGVEDAPDGSLLLMEITSLMEMSDE